MQQEQQLPLHCSSCLYMRSSMAMSSPHGHAMFMARAVLLRTAHVHSRLTHGMCGFDAEFTEQH
jgi:hypothetical protein